MTVSVIREPAVGAMELHLMLYLAPSIAKVLLRPTKPSLAEIRTQTIKNQKIKFKDFFLRSTKSQ